MTKQFDRMITSVPGRVSLQINAVSSINESGLDKQIKRDMDIVATLLASISLSDEKIGSFAANPSHALMKELESQMFSLAETMSSQHVDGFVKTLSRSEHHLAIMNAFMKSFPEISEEEISGDVCLGFVTDDMRLGSAFFTDDAMTFADKDTGKEMSVGYQKSGNIISYEHPNQGQHRAFVFRLSSVKPTLSQDESPQPE